MLFGSTNPAHPIFDRVCNENDIEHRLAKMKHPWPTARAARLHIELAPSRAGIKHLKKHCLDGQDAPTP